MGWETGRTPLEGVVWLQADSSQVTALTRCPRTQQSNPCQRRGPGGWWTPGSPPPSSAQRSSCLQSPRDVWDPAGAEQSPSSVSSVVPGTRTCLSVGTTESGGGLAPVPRADLAQGLWGQRPGRARGQKASASLITLLSQRPEGQRFPHHSAEAAVGILECADPGGSQSPPRTCTQDLGT